MTQAGCKRKLSVILSADIEGYSRLMDNDEEATIRTINTYRTAIHNLVQQYRGRIVDSTGDKFLARIRMGQQLKSINMQPKHRFSQPPTKYRGSIKGTCQ